VQVPLAIADALRLGRLGVSDVHRLDNLKADTRMRLSIGGAPLGEEPVAAE
jgi:uncharacterized protein YqfA (UPF0365 family)